VTLVAAFAAAAHAGMRYGPIEISGSVDSQTLLRSAEIDEWQFVQNRNTALLRLDYDWLQDGRYIDRFDVPFLKRSKLYLLYRGVYDSFWGIAPGGSQKGVTEYDDRVGGPIIGPPIGTQVVNGRSCQSALDPNCVCPPGQVCTGRGIYTRTGSPSRDALAYENRMREAYIDLARADIPDDWGTAGKVLGWLLPTSARLGRQQVIWGESDYFRLMDVINPLDTTWHLGFEEWDKLRIPLWLIKGIWDMGDVGPISNAFTEIVWNPGDFQPGNKVEFLPAPWAVPIANPVRAGQIQVADPNSPSSMLTPLFNLEGTSFRKGDFHRDPADASDIGIRFHGVTDIPLVHMQGFEFTANYPGASAEVHARYRATLPDAAVLLIAVVQEVDQTDPDPLNNTAQLTTHTRAAQARLSLAMTINPATAKAGETLPVRLTIRNDGSNDATQVAIRSYLPPGTSFAFSTNLPRLDSSLVLPRLAAGAQPGSGESW
jgi:uncharacterized repeat protein (TIGR01451 family)